MACRSRAEAPPWKLRKQDLQEELQLYFYRPFRDATVGQGRWRCLSRTRRDKSLNETTPLAASRQKFQWFAAMPRTSTLSLTTGGRSLRERIFSARLWRTA